MRRAEPIYIYMGHEPVTEFEYIDQSNPRVLRTRKNVKNAKDPGQRSREYAQKSGRQKVYSLLLNTGFLNQH